MGNQASLCGHSLDKSGKEQQPTYSKQPEDEAFLSDWTIELYLEEDEGGACSSTDTPDEAKATCTIPVSQPVAVYSVHRFVLGFQCLYFHRLFSSTEQFEECYTSTTKIAVPKIVSLHFDAFLDLLYKKTMTLTHDNIVPIIYLADYLQVNWLQKECVIQLSTLTRTYYAGSTSIDEENIMKFFEASKRLGGFESVYREVAKCCCLFPHLLEHGRPLSMEPEVWQLVPTYLVDSCSWEWDEKPGSLFKLQWVKIIVELFQEETRPSFADRHLFDKLTSSKMMPYIESSKEGKNLIEIEQFLMGVGGGGGGSDDDEDDGREDRTSRMRNKMDTDSSVCISRLQHRCLLPILENISNHHDIEELSRCYGHLPPLVSLEIYSGWLEDPRLPPCEQNVMILNLEGAGSPEVNGVYHRVPVTPLLPRVRNFRMFEKEGRYEGADVLFRIYKYNTRFLGVHYFTHKVVAYAKAEGEEEEPDSFDKYGNPEMDERRITELYISEKLLENSAKDWHDDSYWRGRVGIMPPPRVTEYRHPRRKSHYWSDCEGE